MKDKDKVIKLVPKDGAKLNELSEQDRAEIIEMLGLFAAAVDAYGAGSFAAVAVTHDGEAITTFTSLGKSMLPLVGALEGLKSELVQPMYLDEE